MILVCLLLSLSHSFLLVHMCASMCRVSIRVGRQRLFSQYLAPMLHSGDYLPNIRPVFAFRRYSTPILHARDDLPNIRPLFCIKAMVCPVSDPYFARRRSSSRSMSTTSPRSSRAMSGISCRRRASWATQTRSWTTSVCARQCMLWGGLSSPAPR